MTYLLFLMSGGGGGSQPSLFTSLIPILLIFVIFYFLLIRPQQKKQKEHQDMVSALRKGDRVVTNGGIFGTVSDVKEHIVVLRIAENVKVEIAKSAVATVIEKREN